MLQDFTDCLKMLAIDINYSSALFSFGSILASMQSHVAVILDFIHLNISI